MLVKMRVLIIKWRMEEVSISTIPSNISNNEIRSLPLSPNAIPNSALRTLSLIRRARESHLNGAKTGLVCYVAVHI